MRQCRTCRRPRPSSPSWPSATAASCTSTATACSGPSRRPRTSCRRRCCARGAGGTRWSATSGSARGLYKIATNACLDAIKRAGAARAVARLVPRRPVAAALPGPAARGGRPGGGRARRGGRSARETIELDVPRRDPAAAAAPAGGADPPRRARLARERRRRAARARRRGGQQRAAAGAGDAARPAAGGPARGLDRAGGQRGRARAARRLHRHARARRRRGRARADQRRHPRHDAAAPVPVRGPRRRSRACCARAFGPESAGGVAAGADRAPTGSRPPRATCARTATRCSARSSSTCCGSRTAGSPRSRRSTRRCSTAFGLRADALSPASFSLLPADAGILCHAEEAGSEAGARRPRHRQPRRPAGRLRGDDERPPAP